MAIVRWTPMRQMRDLQQEMSRIFGRPFVSLFEEPAQALGYGPSMDVYSKDSDLVVRMELPGVKTEDLDITLTEHTLVISGEQRAEKEVKEENYYRRERSFGRFERTLPVPEKVTEGDVDASYEDGVLEVKVKGAVEHEAPRHIEVKKKGEKKVIEGE